MCGCGDMTCPRNHPPRYTVTGTVAGGPPTYPPRYCDQCDRRLSRYNPLGRCWNGHRR